MNCIYSLSVFYIAEGIIIPLNQVGLHVFEAVLSAIIDVSVDKEGYPQILKVVRYVLEVNSLCSVPLTDSSRVTIQLLHPAELHRKKQTK